MNYKLIIYKYIYYNIMNKDIVSKWHIYVIFGHLKNTNNINGIQKYNKGIYIGITKNIEKRKAIHLKANSKSSKILLDLFNIDKMFFTELFSIIDNRKCAELLETFITLLFKYNFMDYSVYGGYYNNKSSYIIKDNIDSYYCSLFNIDNFYYSYNKKSIPLIEENRNKIIYYINEFCNTKFKFKLETGIINEIELNKIIYKDFDNDIIMI